jgi:hypothetical protein
MKQFIINYGWLIIVWDIMLLFYIVRKEKQRKKKNEFNIIRMSNGKHFYSKNPRA